MPQSFHLGGFSIVHKDGEVTIYPLNPKDPLRFMKFDKVEQAIDFVLKAH